MSDERLTAATRKLYHRLQPATVGSRETHRAVCADHARRVLAAADEQDAADGIVRVDCSDPDTVERVARALYDLFHEAVGIPARRPFADNHAHEQQPWRDSARAVLDAIKEGQ